MAAVKEPILKRTQKVGDPIVSTIPFSIPIMDLLLTLKGVPCPDQFGFTFNSFARNNYFSEAPMSP
jgi:hypothetical protein